MHACSCSPQHPQLERSFDHHHDIFQFSIYDMSDVFYITDIFETLDTSDTFGKFDTFFKHLVYL